VLALLTHDFVVGNVTASEFISLTSRAELRRRILDGDARSVAGAGSLTVGCLGVSSNTYTYSADLNEPSLCMDTDNEFLAALLRMDAGNWALFLISLVSAVWLGIVIVAAWIYATGLTCCVNGVEQRGFFLGQPGWASAGSPPVTKDGTWPHLAVLVPCYMPNEQVIIEETLHKLTSLTQYPGRMDVIVPYNTPKPLPEIEERLQAISEMGGHSFVAVNVPGSTSKAHNLEYALEKLVADSATMIMIFDADHHVRPETVATLVGALHDKPEIAACQGAVFIERGGPWYLRHFAAGMEWSSWCFWGSGFGLLCGSAHFGGGNAVWRKDVLNELGFDSTMLTEDIDVTVRAMSAGYRLAFVPWARVAEMCPVGLGPFYKQRLRWAMGWEQCTFRRMVAVFNSTAIPETRKWQTALLLVMRYWSISTAAFAATMIVTRTITEWATGHPVYQSAPLVLVGRVQSAIFISTILGHALVMLRFQEPWWRWLQVAYFIPLSGFYLSFQSLLITVSWFRLFFFSEHEWVPTARDGSKGTPQAKTNTTGMAEPLVAK